MQKEVRPMNLESFCCIFRSSQKWVGTLFLLESSNGSLLEQQEDSCLTNSGGSQKTIRTLYLNQVYLPFYMENTPKPEPLWSAPLVGFFYYLKYPQGKRMACPRSAKGCGSRGNQGFPCWIPLLDLIRSNRGPALPAPSLVPRTHASWGGQPRLSPGSAHEVG